jgi:predicted alpha/beta superfamily hydrolase
MNVFKILSVLTMLTFAVNYDASSQGSSAKADSTGLLILPNIDTWVIHSSSIGEDYTIYVLRTEAYDTTNIRLPVLYMTDGDWNMTVAMNCFRMLRQDYVTEEPLIVGIGYGKGPNKRFRDLDPKTGAPAFLGFIQNEVIPFVNAKYRTNEEKAIYGYSMGGMFTTYILFNQPWLFEKIFIGAPGNNGSELMPAAKKYFADHKDLKSEVFVGVGNYEHEVVRNIDSFKNYLLSQKCPGLKIRTEITPSANHGAALAQVMQNAIAFGYCETHERAVVTPGTFSQVAGVYSDDSKSEADLLVFIKNNKLYMQWQTNGSVALELIPQSPSEYFIKENEQLLFRFAKESNKSKLIVSQGKSQYPFTRKK